MRMNPDLTGLECLRCGAAYGVVDLPAGCPRCLAEGHPANVRCVFAADSPGPALPVLDGPDLGQGGTPLFRLPAGLSPAPDVWVKSEAANPTGSHKDRFSAGAVGRAAVAGYAGVVGASSGNAALSLAAFSASIGLRCAMAVTTGLPAVIRTALDGLGAEVHVFDDPAGRWTFVAGQQHSAELLPVTNFVTPVVGSSPYGIAGFGPIASEISRDLGAPPDVVLVPASRADLASGISLGFAERERRTGEAQPRIYIVEPIPRLAAVLAGADVRESFPGGSGDLVSIGGDSTTVQALAAVRRSGGGAVTVDAGRTRPWHERAWRAGLTWEISSSTVLAALADLLAGGRVGPDERVVLIATSHGFKGL